MEENLRKGDAFRFEGEIHLPDKTERSIEVNCAASIPGLMDQVPIFLARYATLRRLKE